MKRFSFVRTNPMPSKHWNPFSLEQWIAWLGATVIAAISMTIFFYKNFETKDQLAEYKENQEKYSELFEKRLDRIENKLDRLLTQTQK